MIENNLIKVNFILFPNRRSRGIEAGPTQTTFFSDDRKAAALAPPKRAVLKALKMAVIHVAFFILSWTPYTVIATWWLLSSIWICYGMQSSYLSRTSRIIFVEKKYVTWRNVSFLYRNWTIYGVYQSLCCFCSKICGEKSVRWKMCGEKMTNMRSDGMKVNIYTIIGQYWGIFH